MDIPIKNKEETYENIIEIGRNNDYTSGNLLNNEYFSINYKLITIESSQQIELEDADTTQQINFIDTLERNERATRFFIIEKTEEIAFNFSKKAKSVI